MSAGNDQPKTGGPRIPAVSQLLSHSTLHSCTEVVYHATALGELQIAIAVTSRICTLLSLQGRPTEAERLARGLIYLSPEGSSARTASTVAVADAVLRTNPEASLSLLDELPHTETGEQWLRNRRGIAMIQLARYDEAREIFEEAAKRARRDGDAQEEAYALDELGLIARNTGGLTAALKFHGAALKIHESLQDPVALCVCLLGLARTHMAREDFPQAAATAERAYGVAKINGMYEMAANSAVTNLECLDRGGLVEQGIRFGTSVVAVDALAWPTGDPRIADALGHMHAFLSTAGLNMTNRVHDLRLSESHAWSASEYFGDAGDSVREKKWAEAGAAIARHIDTILADGVIH